MLNNKMVILLFALIAALLLSGLSIYFGISTSVIQAHAAVLSRSTTTLLISSVTPTPGPTSHSGFLSTIDTTLLGAIIGGACTLFVGIIAVVSNIWQSKRNHQINLKLEQVKKERDEHLLNLRLEARATAREERRKETEAEALRIKMEQARSIEEQVRAYQAALLADGFISNLQILGMSKPLKVEEVYVPVQVHQIDAFKTELDPELRKTEDQQNPDVLLKVEQERRKGRANSTYALDPGEAIRGNPRCVILGDPGAGKTTLLKYLALKSVRNVLIGLPDLPIFIELNKFVNSVSGDLLDFAATQWDENYAFPKDNARTYMEDNLKAGKALLILDALDETMIGDTLKEAQDNYDRVANAVMKLANRYPQSPVVVTARKAGYRQRNPLRGFTQLEVADFRPEDVIQFVNNWFMASEPQQGQSKAADLIKKMELNPRIQALAANPLLLSLIVIVYKAPYDLPSRRVDLYERCIGILLGKWDEERDIRRRREFSPKHIQQLLPKIAWKFHNEGRRYFPESDLLDAIAQFLPTIGRPVEEKSQVLAEIEDVYGLLKPQAWRWHGFLHLTFQEYFVAQYIVDHNELDTLLSHLGEPWWEEIILLYAAQVPDASPLLQKLLNLDGNTLVREDIFHTNLILAGRCLVDQPTVEYTSLREEVVSRLSELLLSTTYSLTKEQAIYVLASLGPTSGTTAATDFLLRSLHDETIEQSIRWRIAEAFGTVGERSIEPQLLSILSDTNIDQVLRQTTAETLGMLGDRSIAGSLLGLFRTFHHDSDMQRSIVKALGILGNRSVAQEMLSWLSDQDIEIRTRCSIAEALGLLGEQSIVAPLLELLTSNHTHHLLRDSIIHALGMLGNRSLASQLPALLAKESNRTVSYHIIETVARLNGQDILPEMLKLTTDPHIDPNVRKYITIISGRLGEKSVIPDLLNILHDSAIDPYVRRGAADTLGTLGNQSVVNELLGLLENARLDRSVRMSIADALSRLGDNSVVPRLLKMLVEHQTDPYVCRSIAEALGTLGESSAVPQLLDLLTDTRIDQRTRQITATVIGNLANDQTTVERLAALISTSDITDYAYNAMWAVSRRARVRVFMLSGPNGQEVQVKKQ